MKFQLADSQKILEDLYESLGNMNTHKKTNHMKYYSIVLFATGTAYGFFPMNKMGMRHNREHVFERVEGVFTKELLKKTYPNASIKVYNDPKDKSKITVFEKSSLHEIISKIEEAIIRKDKIDKLLNDE